MYSTLKTLLADMPPTSVLQTEGLHFVPIDLSVTNTTLPDSDPDLADYIEAVQERNYAVAFGGYNEKRNLYKKSNIFDVGSTQERDIHIGLDLWTTAGTSVLAALDGTIHSFNDNAGVGNYGPTIILEHKISGETFYTLYGHLALESLDSLKIGTIIRKGLQIGTLGNSSVNGGYAPHLHFQIISDLQGNQGDYPGVCSESDLKFYLNNCPDPNLLLNLKN